jgi:uncharacterized SAM-binding protein YcdF (DUF218 family)
MLRFLAAVIAFLLLCGLVFILLPGGFLVVNNPEKSDVIVVLAGTAGDLRYFHGMELLRAGYAHHLVLDYLSGEMYGRSMPDLAREFVAQTAGPYAAQVSVCPMDGDSTKDEAPQVNGCFQHLNPPPRSAIIVTDDYHTRRALSIFRNRLPQYRWTAGATKNDFLFGEPWWKQREWAKTYLTEWQKLIWWEFFDRWRK